MKYFFIGSGVAFWIMAAAMWVYPEGFKPKETMAEATYYDAGSLTASGEPYMTADMTCAAPKEIPFGTWIKVWPALDKTGNAVYVRVNDRCKEGLDLTPAAFQKLAPLNRGRITIKYKIVD